MYFFSGFDYQTQFFNSTLIILPDFLLAILSLILQDLLQMLFYIFKNIKQSNNPLCIYQVNRILLFAIFISSMQKIPHDQKSYFRNKKSFFQTNIIFALQEYNKQKNIKYSFIIQFSYKAHNRIMSFYRNQYENIAENTYNAIRSNTGVYAERNSLRNPAQRPGPYNEMVSNTQNYKQTNSPPRRNSIAKLNDIRKKFHQVIDLCKGQNADVKGQLGQVISQERQIYNLLAQNPNLLQRTISQQSFPQTNQYMGQTVPLRPTQKRQQIITPFMQQKPQYVPESQYFIPNFSQVGAKQNNYPPNISHSNVLRQESGYLNQPDHIQLHQPFAILGEYENQPDNLQSSIHRLKQTKQIQLNDDALRLIQQIERKAFEEIQKLRRQKLELMQRLNQQIRNVNEQKKKNAQLENLLTQYSSRAQRPDNSVHAGQNTQYLQEHISRLQTELQRANSLNNNLKLELASRGSGVPGIQELLRQGEAIRQESLRLLKLKQSGDGNQRIRQLQRRLAAEQAQKQNALNQVKALRERLGDSSQSRSYQQNTSYQKPTPRVQSPQTYGKSAGHYEDLVSEMKRITGN